MDLRYTLQGIEFAWDSTKATANLSKHRVNFETACEAFFDPFICPLDQQKHEGETRDVFIGMTLRWNVLYVVYTLRQNDVFRIISARPATPEERRQYEEQ